MMIATINEDVFNIIEEFKKQVNPSFKPSGADIANIKYLMKSSHNGRSNKDGGDILYYCVDYEGLKRHNVKDFSFSIPDYEEWVKETIELSKARRVNNAKR